MRVIWIGLKITEKQYKKLLKNLKGNEILICPDALLGAKFMGRRIKLKDLVPGRIERIEK